MCVSLKESRLICHSYGMGSLSFVNLSQVNCAHIKNV